ncbi:MAG: hypothetical protein IPF92_17120 [Myxococcales bacterium]|nr:hypothetical protein [Myxococcales bacterium]
MDVEDPTPPLVHCTGEYEPPSPFTASLRQPSRTFISQPSYFTTTMSLAAYDWKVDWSVASHSTMNGRSWFLGLQRFCPAKVLSASFPAPPGAGGARRRRRRRPPRRARERR